MASRRALIEAQDLHRIYGTGGAEVAALRGVSFTIYEGEFVSIMGPSGSGKSTLLHVLGCLDSPTRGRFLFDGEALEGCTDAELSAVRNRKIGFVFQSYNLIPQLDLVGNVELPMLYARLDPASRRARALEVVGLVELGDRLDHRPTELSGGQCQRVAIARALVNRPRLLLADEPTGNLDSVTGERILGLFQALNRAGITIVMVTHDAGLARHTSRILSLRDGSIEEDVPVDAPCAIAVDDACRQAVEAFWRGGAP